MKNLSIYLFCFLFILIRSEDNTTSVNDTNTTNITYCTSKCCSDRFDRDGLNSDPTYYNESNFSYCKTVITWSISEQVYAERQRRDQQALSLYKTIYEKWKDPNKAETDDPTNDCLGIARIVFCSYKYPLCLEEDGDQNEIVCDFLCSLYKQRCPSESEAYNIICANKRKSDCAVSRKLWAMFGMAFMYGFIFLLLVV